MNLFFYDGLALRLRPWFIWLTALLITLLFLTKSSMLLTSITFAVAFYRCFEPKLTYWSQTDRILKLTLLQISSQCNSLMKHLVKHWHRRGKHLVRVLRGHEVAYGIQVQCQREHHGTDYGGWYICPTRLDAHSVVYSCGIGYDISFDLSLIRRFGLHVHGFDPTPSSLAWVAQQQPLPNFTMHAIGIAAHDGPITLYAAADPRYKSYSAVAATGNEAGLEAQASRIKTLMTKFGHQQIDLLKLDIEGSEYAVIADVLAAALSIDQILVEFHHRLPGIGIGQTRQAIAMLNKHGYKIFAVSANGNEYSFQRI